jgi:WD40 repeat protein
MGRTGPHFAEWDVSTGQLIRQFDFAAGTAMLSPDGTNVVAGLMLINPETGDVIRRYPIARSVSAGVDISPDSRYMVGGDFFGLIVVWDFQTADELRTFSGHRAMVWNVVFDPDGRTFYSSSYDGEVIQWQFADWPLDKLLAWVRENRYVRDFTCEERAQYRIEPLCE